MVHGGNGVAMLSSEAIFTVTMTVHLIHTSLSIVSDELQEDTGVLFYPRPPRVCSGRSQFWGNCFGLTLDPCRAVYNIKVLSTCTNLAKLYLSGPHHVLILFIVP